MTRPHRHWTINGQCTTRMGPAAIQALRIKDNVFVHQCTGGANCNRNKARDDELYG